MTSAPFGPGLTAAAQARLARIKASGTWDSALSTEEFAALKAVGFEPVGQVLGAAVYRVGFAGGTVCPTCQGATGSQSASDSGHRMITPVMRSGNDAAVN
jgi:hypothetical protein